jgi:catalase
LAEETIAPDEQPTVVEFIAFLKATSAKHHPTGVVPRFNQGRAAGCVEAEFIVPADLAPDLRVGLFAQPRTYNARIRFANASSQSDRERDVRGMSIKVYAAAAENLTAGQTDHDFILNSHPVMMVGRTRQFLELLQAVDAGGAKEALFFIAHPHAAAVALAARQHATSHLEIPYWSTTPYLFGPGRAVKYVARPASSGTTPLPDPLTDTYLRERLAAHLAREGAEFDFLVQFQTDSRTMPIEDARVEWHERDSPYRRVARIRIPMQTVDEGNRSESCEQMAFNPWHAIADHRPLGDFNRARREIYSAMAAFRRERTPPG